MNLPDDAREGAVLFTLAARAAMAHGPSLARAGFAGAPLEAACALFEQMIAAESGVGFAIDEWPETWRRAATPDGKLHLALPDLLDEVARLADPPAPDAAFPFVLSAGERRSFTANTIVRDPAGRKKDAAGALRIDPDGAATFGGATGESLRLIPRGNAVVVPIEVSATMPRGHVSLPNGLGLVYPSAQGETPRRRRAERAHVDGRP